ncbi:MAG TPA: acetyl-CoA C-acyltransferase [Gemmatimonadales bacterium]|nr:acetyl-CoA C-acyltransferase [Gemmatimonadales bacterium]
MTTGIVFLSAVRTGFGAFGGTLKDLSATQLGAIAAEGALARSGLTPGDIDHVVIGNAQQTSPDAIYLARHVGLRAGCPVETPALTVNRLCGSGFEAVVQAAQLIALGEARAVLAGGTESMSQAPHVLRGARFGGFRFGQAPGLEDSLWAALRDSYCDLPMAETAENLAAKYGVSRGGADEYAFESQRRAQDAWRSEAFKAELVPVPITDRKTRGVTQWAADEVMRPDTTLEGLAKLQPVFRKDGIVTAGNASGLADGAAALVVCDEAFATERDLKPIGRLVSYAVAGVPPEIMGIGPAPAARAALARAGLDLDDMDLVEVNEAFAPQYLAVERELDLDRDRTNVDGGAIALGHPLGASGARIVTHLLHALRRRQEQYALGSACIGGGQGIAVIVERLD